MAQQADQIREYIENNFRFIYVNPANGDIALPYGTDDACWWMQIKVRGDGDREWVEVGSRWPVNVPRERRAVMCELLQRIENTLILGKFEFDLDGDGEVRFCTTFRYGDAPVKDEHIHHLIGTNLATVREHLPHVVSVAYQGADPRDVLRHEDDVELPADLDTELAGLLEELGIDSPAAEDAEGDGPSEEADESADEGHAA